MSLFKKKKDIEEIELSEKHVGLRWTLVAVFLAVGLICIAVFLFSLLGEEEGWQTIAPTDKSFMPEGEISLQYNLGTTEISPSKEKKEVEKVYTEALSASYKLFDVYRAYDGIVNLHYINQHPNEELTVDRELYKAFELIESFNNRSIYLGTVLTEYRKVFSSTDDLSAELGDPNFNEEAKHYIEELTRFTGDPNSINIELLGDNKIKLNVSADYAALFVEYDEVNYIDLAWLTNAFVVDGVANALAARGYTNGYVISYEGYVRYLDSANNRYSLNLNNRQEKTVYPAGVAHCENIRSLVQFRNYPINEINSQNYYAYSNGTFATRHLNSDGYYVSALNDILAYSSSKNCAQIALELSEIFIQEDLDLDRIMQNSNEDIYTIWFEDSVIYYNDKNLQISEIYDNNGIKYTINCVE
ncbi:MAG: hypothetical protein E7642_00725 [Ruminococcaceae bacterium]|nr:hypothetical protein [Oscillospiraceae bacterium]